MKEQTIKLSTINDILKNKSKYFVNEQKGYIGIPNGSEGEQGQYNETFKFYKHPEFPKNIFLRETYNSDSYGWDDRLVGISFVEGKEKTITIFEPIN